MTRRASEIVRASEAFGSWLWGSVPGLAMMLRTLARSPASRARARTIALDVRSVRNCRGSGCLRGSVLAPGSAPELAHPPAHAPGDGDAAHSRDRSRVGGLERVHKAAGEGRGASGDRASAVA